MNSIIAYTNPSSYSGNSKAISNKPFLFPKMKNKINQKRKYKMSSFESKLFTGDCLDSNDMWVRYRPATLLVKVGKYPAGTTVAQADLNLEDNIISLWIEKPLEKDENGEDDRDYSNLDNDWSTVDYKFLWREIVVSITVCKKPRVDVECLSPSCKFSNFYGRNDCMRCDKKLHELDSEESD